MLDNVDVSGSGTIAANLTALPETLDSGMSKELALTALKEGGLTFDVEIEVEQGVAHLRGRAELAPGTYRIHANREQEWFATNRIIVVADDGSITLA